MGSYLLKRLGLTVLTVWGSLTIMFILLVAMPGDAVTAKQGEKSVGAATLNNVRKKYGLDKSVPEQYVRYWTDLGQGDLGYTVKNDKSVNTMLSETASNSLRLLFWGGVVQIFGSLGLGFLAAARRNSVVDRVTTAASVAAQAIPVFVTGLLLQVLFGVIPNNFSQQTGWLKHTGFLNFNTFQPSEWALWVFPKDNWKGWVLPSIAVGIVNMAFLARLLRSSMLEVIRADYLRTAKAKGIGPLKVLVKHALRNALIPWVTAASLSLVEIFGIAVQTEGVFGINGIGSQIASSALEQDTRPILGLTSVVVLATALTMLLIDLSYSFLDPRIRVGDKLAA
jgi:ABC-type dipeptide/oligopeptide/nickel transport system permease component